jgi:hypothetical protein
MNNISRYLTNIAIYLVKISNIIISINPIFWRTNPATALKFWEHYEHYKQIYTLSDLLIF